MPFSRHKNYSLFLDELFPILYEFSFGSSSLQRLGSVGEPQPPLMFNNSEAFKALMFLIEFFIY
jgi:hypothetical protein